MAAIRDTLRHRCEKTRRHDVHRRAESRQGKLAPRSSSWCIPHPYYASPRDGVLPDCTCLNTPMRASLLENPSTLECINSSPTSIRLWYWSYGIHVRTSLLLAIGDAPSE